MVSIFFSRVMSPRPLNYTVPQILHLGLSAFLNNPIYTIFIQLHAVHCDEIQHYIPAVQNVGFLHFLFHILFCVLIFLIFCLLDLLFLVFIFFIFNTTHTSAIIPPTFAHLTMKRTNYFLIIIVKLNNQKFSIQVLERAMFHFQNTYKIPNVKVGGYMCKTNLPSNTAFRGFGGPQGMFFAENMIRDMANFLDKDPIKVIYYTLN